MLAHAHNKFKFKSESYTTSDVLVITVQEYIIYVMYDVILKSYLKITVTVKVIVKGTVTVKVTVKGTVTTKKLPYMTVNFYVLTFKNVLNNYWDQKTL